MSDPTPEQIAAANQAEAEAAALNNATEADAAKAKAPTAPTKLSQIKPADILGQRDLGNGLVSVVTVHGARLTVANDAKK